MALKAKRIYITYGRFQPVTWGHENSFNAIAKAAGGDPYRIFISHTNDRNENPLKQDAKLFWMKLLLPRHASKIVALNPSQPQTCVRYCMTQSKDIPYDCNECVYMVGSDRVNAMQYLHKYNGCNPDAKVIDFSMKHFEIRSTGQRDADGKTFAISGTKMRQWARDGEIDEFKRGLPKSHKLNDDQIEKFMKLL
tara:strand:+ start:1526 stop:2107 length:582 start_codon:yes stop_codon:yes gene_type:complete